MMRRVLISGALYFSTAICVLWPSQVLALPPNAKCYSGDSSNYVLDRSLAKHSQAAIEGDLESAQAIVSQLRAKSERSTADSVEGCRFKVWKEVAAANGDIQSAYELAFGSDKAEWYSCGRAKYWAAFYIRRMGDGRISIKDRSQSTEMKITQMRAVLRMTCPTL